MNVFVRASSVLHAKDEIVKCTHFIVSEYTWSEWTSCSGAVDCKCGSCTSRTRHRLCDGEECPKSLALTQHRRCSEKCAEKDQFTRLIGQVYTV